jgi:ribonuclease I
MAYSLQICSNGRAPRRYRKKHVYYAIQKLEGKFVFKQRLMRALLLSCLFVAIAIGWDYFTFSLQWSCEERRFTIHGLWPDDANGSYPSFCRGVPFDVSSLDDLLPRLNAYWPSDKGSNIDFWKHEYEKHGTCAIDDGVFDDQHAYFVAALDLASRYSTAFNSTWPTPSNEILYATNALEDALESRWDVSVNVACVGSKKVLSEVRFCFSKALESMDCYASRDDFCADYVYMLNCAK